MKAKIIILSVLTVVVVAGAGSCYWLMRSPKKIKTADFSSQTREQIRAYLRSAEFRKLDEQTRMETARVAFRQMQERTVNDYFALPADQRAEYMNKLIDEMLARRKERAMRGDDPNSRSNDPNARQRRRQQRQAARTPENRRARLEAIDPLTRAKMAAFRDAMRAQMAQRGVSGGGGGGGGGGRRG